MSKKHLRTVASITEQIVDEDTGELVSSNTVTHRIMVGKKEDFFLLYSAALSLFKDITGPAIKVYAYLLLNYKAGSPIVINKFIKEQVIEFMGSKNVGTVDNSLSELCKTKLLHREATTTGVYYINPRYAFKGSTTDRNASLKAIIELGCEDC